MGNKFLFEEISGKLQSLTIAKRRLSEKGLSREQRREFEEVFCKTAGWFLFYEIDILYNNGKYVLRRGSNTIVSDIMPEEHEFLMNKMMKLYIQMENNSSLQSEVFVLQSYLESLGYKFEIEGDKLKVIVEREQFNFGE